MEKVTQNAIITRLDEQLSIKRYEFKQTHLPRTHWHTSVPFHLFTEWIGIQAQVHLERQEDNSSAPTPQSKFGYNQFNQTRTSSPTLARKNTYSREYRDTFRSRGNNNTIYNKSQNNSRISQLDISTTGSEFQQPLHDSLKRFGILKSHYVFGNHVRVEYKVNYAPRYVKLSKIHRF